MLIPSNTLPPTRLELRWRKVDNATDELNWFCDYHLVLELKELDIRGEVYGDDGQVVRRDREKRLELGGTRSTGNRGFVNHERGEIRTPYRDGAHIKWDGERLGLRMFVVHDEYAQELLLGAEAT